jgi:oxygen-independent coproporphyrinogen-3 oxidase
LLLHFKTTTLAGIYIHIPFCKQACNYCNFHFSTSLRYKTSLIAAIVQEIEQPASLVQQQEPIETIYFGGGTPSLCTEAELHAMLTAIYKNFTVVPGAEITFETNPDDISLPQLEMWQRNGINRLSIGVQSFFEEDLLWMNRTHNARQAITGLELAISRFDNITIDLIYGTPGLTHEKWQQNVAQAVDLGIPHLSCYALTVEPKTPLDKQIRLQQKSNVDPGFQSEQFLLLMQWAKEAGYEHYEISNFAKPGYRSKHNSSYWQGKNYWGFGPSAHAFNGTKRWWNIANNAQYIHAITHHQPAFETETLTPVQQVNEFVMIALRTMEGLSLTAVAGKWPELMIDNQAVHPATALLTAAQPHIQAGQMVYHHNHLQLTNEGKLLADGITADLFL